MYRGERWVGDVRHGSKGQLVMALGVVWSMVRRLYNRQESMVPFLPTSNCLFSKVSLELVQLCHNMSHEYHAYCV